MGRIIYLGRCTRPLHQPSSYRGIRSTTTFVIILFRIDPAAVMNPGRIDSFGMLNLSTEKKHPCLTPLSTSLHLVNSVSIRVRAVYSRNKFLVLFLYYRPVSINQLPKIELTNKDQRKVRANRQHGLAIFFIYISFLRFFSYCCLSISFYIHKILIATPTSYTMCTKRLWRLSS